jgi:hypothetical protein
MSCGFQELILSCHTPKTNVISIYTNYISFVKRKRAEMGMLWKVGEEYA